MWCADGQVEKGGTNLIAPRVYSRPVEIAFLLHCQALSHLSLYQCCVYMHRLFFSQRDLFFLDKLSRSLVKIPGFLQNDHCEIESMTCFHFFIAN